MTQTQQIKASDTPNVVALAAEFKRAEDSTSAVGRVVESDNARYNRWEGQSRDGKKWDKNLPDGDQAFPWDGSNDSRVHLIDAAINDLVDIQMTAFNRANVKISGVEVNDAKMAAVFRGLMRWIVKGKLSLKIRSEAELSAQYQNHYGWCLGFIGWEQAIEDRAFKIDAAKIEETYGTEVLELLLDPEKRTAAVDFVEQLLPAVSRKKLRRMIVEFTKTGTAEVPVPRVVRNLPFITALKPYEEVVVPPEFTEPERANIIFRVDYMTPEELDMKVLMEEWDEDWVELVKDNIGQTGDPGDIASTGTTNTDGSIALPGIADSSTSGNAEIDSRDNLAQVIYAYARQTDDLGVTGIYETVFSLVSTDDHSDSPLFGRHRLLDYAHGKMPFVKFVNENVGRPISTARGVSDVNCTQQNEMKIQHDSLTDSTSLTTLPPIVVNKRISSINRIGPAQQLPANRPDDYTSLQFNNSTTTAFVLMDRLEKNMAAYWGLPHPEIPRDMTQAKQQNRINRWLESWSEAYKQMFALSIQFLSSAEIERITGAPFEAPSDFDIEAMFDFILHYDVKELDTEYNIKRLGTIATSVAPLDRNGKLNMDGLIEVLVESIIPDAAPKIMFEEKEASQRLYEGVQNDIGKMMLGFEPNYVENDPTADTKLKFAQDIVQRNPKVVQVVQEDPEGLTAQLLQNYQKNLQLSASQEQNKTIGRQGVVPIT